MSIPSASTLTEDFFSWADSYLSGPQSDATVAFHFNLYEGEDSVHVQLIGTDSFTLGEDPATDYWPGAETSTTGEEVFEIPYFIAGTEWRQWLQTSKNLITRYIETGKNSSVLRKSQGVGVGFVEGDMHVLWRASDA